ncbi:MAG: glycosyltransferase family 39 protein [Candidatus Binatia bacterium]
MRLAWGLAAGVTPGGSGLDDALWYHESAQLILRGNGYVSPFTLQPTAMWPPGYPAVLALGYRLFGASPATAVALNAVFGAVTCWLVWQLGRRLVGVKGALVATALLAAFPSHVFFAALALSETLFTCLVSGLLLAAVALGDRPAPYALGGWILWGAAAGATGLVRSEAIALAAAPALALASLGAWRASGRVLVATVFGALLALTPWIVRNVQLFGVVVPTSTSFGRTLWIGHNPLATGGMTVAINDAMQALQVRRGPFEWSPAGGLAMDRMLLDDALAFAVAHPLRELALVPARVYHLFRGDHVWQAWYHPGTPQVAPSDTARRLLGRIGDGYYLVVGIVAVAGWLFRRPSRAAAWRQLDVACIVWIGIFALVYGDPRFHHVLMPIGCLLAATALTRDAREPRAARTA